MIVGLAFATTVPRLQGNPPVQGAVAETKPRPGGVRSPTTTSLASDGPGFVTVIVKVTFVPGVTLAGPVFVMPTSASAASVVVSVALSLAGSGSVVSAGGATLAVLVS